MSKHKLTEEVKNKKMEKICLDISEELYEALSSQSKKENITEASLATNILEIHLHTYKEGQGEVYDKKTGGRIFTR